MKIFVAIATVIAIEAFAFAAYSFYTREAAKPIPAGSPTPAPSGEGWTDLLDETNARLWKNVTDDKDIFEIKDGMLHIYGVTVHPLRYVAFPETELGDFDLHLEYRVAPGANSGIFIRKQPNDEIKRGFEIQVLDDFGKPPTKNTSGAIYDITTPMYNLSRPAGEWNSFDIAVRGKQVLVYHNGWLVLYTDLGMMKQPLGKFEYAFNDLPLKGLLALQDHGGEVWYRNIRIHPWAAGAAPAGPAPGAGKGAAPANAAAATPEPNGNTISSP